MVSFIKDFGRFFLNPDFELQNRSRKHIRYIFYGFLVYLLFAIVYYFSLSGLGVPKAAELEKDTSEMLPIMLFWIAVIRAPILEEASWRLFLKYSKVNMATSLALIIGFGYFLNFGSLAIGLGLAGLIFSLVYASLYYFERLETMLKNIGQRYLVLWIILTSLAFGLVHVTNSSNPLDIGTILRTGMQVFGGLVFAFNRYKFGFWYGVATHAVVNFLSFLFMV